MSLPDTRCFAHCIHLDDDAPLPRQVPVGDPPVIGAPASRYRIHGELILPGSALVAALVARDRRAEGSLAIVASNDDSAALCVAAASPFESHCLRIATARIARLLGWGPQAAAMARAALAQTLAVLATRGVRLLLAACDSTDLAATRVLADSGLVRTGTRLTYVYHRDLSVKLDTPRVRYRVRPARDDDAEHVLRLAETVRGGHFHRIALLDATRVAALYREWARKALAGEFADGVLVAVRADVPVAFLSYKALDDVALATGRQVAGRGLGTAHVHASGAYVSVAATALRVVSYEGPFEGGEFDVDSANVSLIRIVERFGLIPGHATHTFYRDLSAAQSHGHA